MAALATGLALLAGGLAALVPGAAQAWCQQTTHDDDTCGAEPGVPLAWHGNCVPYSLHEAGSADLPLDAVAAVARRSFQTWQDAASVGGSACSYLTFSATEVATCDQVGFRQDAGNMNLVVFRESGWTARRNHAAAAMGLTTVLFDPGSGEILSADMELNGEYFRFTDSEVDVDADLTNTMTHEAGHVLGLAHTPEQAATMYGTSTSGETQKGTLYGDDVDAVCSIYPKAQDPGECLPPRGGLDPACLPPEPGCGCRAVGASGTQGTAGALGLVLGGLGLASRRRARARRRA